MQRLFFSSLYSLNDAAQCCPAPSYIAMPDFTGLVDATRFAALDMPQPAEAS